MDIEKVNSLEEAQKHFNNNDAVGQVPPVVCVKNGEERQVENLAEAEAFYAEAPAKTDAEGETKTGESADAESQHTSDYEEDQQ